MPKLGSQSRYSYLKFPTTSSFLHVFMGEGGDLCPGACRESEDGVKESMGRSLSFYPVGLGGGGGGLEPRLGGQLL